MLLGKEANIEMVHVAYKGSAAYANDLMGGSIPIAVDTRRRPVRAAPRGPHPHPRDVGHARSQAVPEVPTFNELGVKNVEASGWFGFFAPARTPPATIELLNRHLNMALRSPDVVDKLRNVGMEPATSTPDEFAKRLAADYAKWGPVVKATGFTAE